MAFIHKAEDEFETRLNTDRGTNHIHPIYPRRPFRRASLPVRFDNQKIDYTDASPGGPVTLDRPERASRRRRSRANSFCSSDVERHGSPIINNIVEGEYSPAHSLSDVDDCASDDERGTDSCSPSHRYYLPGYLDDEWDAHAYPFSLSRHTRSLPSHASTTSSVSDQAESDTPDTPSNIQFHDSYTGKILQVFCSHYTGDGLIEGLQTAKLTASQDTSQRSRSGPQPIFRWIQFEDIHMDFDLFESRCIDIAGLTDSERKTITKLFNRARKKYSKPFHTSGGTKLNVMTPGPCQEKGSSESTQHNPKPGAATWMCLPFFCLKRYSGSLIGLPHSSYPIRTLLQTRFPSVKRERDMQQAVCHLPNTYDEHCFHIDQIWCLVVDDYLMITCSRTPIHSLLGKSISISTEPSTARAPGTQIRRSNQLLVMKGKSLHWSFPLDECETWFDFLSHFWEYWPKRIQFSYNGEPVTPENWPKIHAQASKTIVRLQLETSFANINEPARGTLLATNSAHTHQETAPPAFEISASGSVNNKHENAPFLAVSGASNAAADEPISRHVDTRDGLHPDRAAKARPVKAHVEKHLTKNNFHVFTWMNQIDSTTWSDTEGITALDTENSRAGVVDDPSLMGLQEDLGELDRFLKHKTSFVQKLAYRECHQHSRGDVYDFLGRQETEITTSKKQDDEWRWAYECQVDLVNKAEMLFSFFLPARFHSHTVDKFWGAIYRLTILLSPSKSKMESRESHQDESTHSFATPRINQRDRDIYHALRINSWLATITPLTRYFQELLSQASPSDRSNIELSEEFPRAWVHLLIALSFAIKDNQMAEFDAQSDICRMLLNEGMRKTIQSLDYSSLVEYSALMPFDLVSLINWILLGDITTSSKAHFLDIGDTYLEYLKLLESKMENNPFDRGHQDKISCLKEEIAVILDNLILQGRIVTDPQLFNQPVETRSSPIVVRQTLAADYEIAPMSFHSHASSHHHYSSSQVGPLQGTVYPSRYRSSYRNEDAGRPTNVAQHEKSRPPGTQIDPTDPDGVQGLLIQETQALVDRKIRGFQQMLDRASELEAWNIRRIDYNRDRQEAAIYAFTIVTIIFLPLSTVASILGMNVNDIRNMELNQWVFWVTAIPLTFVIILLCLLWAGELSSFWKGVKILWSNRTEDRRRRNGYHRQVLDSANSSMDVRADESEGDPVMLRPVPLFREKAPKESRRW